MPGRRPPTSFVVLAVLASAVAVFVLVAAQVSLGQASVTEADLRTGIERTATRLELLELEVAELRSPSRIAARASKLGLVHATDVTVLVPAEPAHREGMIVEGR